MGGPKWTNEQLEVIEHRGGNLLVSAAAGSGKTAVLVERIIRMVVEDRIDIDKLLVVTFTNAAASEMRERIADAVAEKLEKNPADEYLQRQMLLINRAKITTIHSFCLDVIKSNIHLTDIDPNFRIGDSTECALMEQEAIDEIFEEKYISGMSSEKDEGSEFLNIIECFAERNGDRKVQEMIIDIAHFASSFPNPYRWLINSAEMFQSEGFVFSESVWAEAIMRYSEIELEGIQKKLETACEILVPYIDVIAKSEKIFNERNTIKEIAESKNWDEFISKISSFEPEDYRKGKKIPKDEEDAKEVWEYAKSLRDDAIKSIKSISSGYGRINQEDISYEMDIMYPVISEIVGTVIEFMKRFQEKKLDKGIIDFSDIEHIALNILTEEDESGELKPSDAALVYREEFKEIFVDEYQDSNFVQESILESIAKPDEPNRFMVGDVKQSIYKFRQARPEIFIDKYTKYPEEKGDLNRKILLYKNFRSRESVLDSVNNLFEKIMSSNVGEIEYNENERLNPGAIFEEYENENKTVANGCEIHLIDKKEEFQSDDEDIDNIQLEARMAGKIIKDIVESKEYMVYDKKEDGYRPAKYRDIVILMRATSVWGQTFSDELTEMKIPVYADAGAGYFDTVEIKTIISLLKIIDNPMQDIPLIAVMRSPMFGFNAGELADIRSCDRNRTFYEALKKHTSSDNGEKSAYFLDKLEKYRYMSGYMSTDELLWYLYSDTGYYSYVAVLPGGEQRQANLRILFERAKQFEDTSFRGIFNFINFVDKLEKSGNEVGEAKTISEASDVVRIMSIHKSKGLEFPIVLCCGMGKKFNMRDMNSDILYHSELGFGMQIVNSDTRLSYPSAIKNIIKKKMELETKSEEMRILYVAMTRAKEKLILTGSVNNVDMAYERWEKISRDIGDYSSMKSNTYIDWIMPVVLDSKSKSENIWNDKIWKKSDIMKTPEDTEEIKKSDIFRKEIDKYSSGRNYDWIKNRLEYEYPYQKSCERSESISVSEIKTLSNRSEDDDSEIVYMSTDENTGTNNEIPIKTMDYEIKVPKFIQDTKDEKLTGAAKGSAVHLFMQLVDLDRVSDIQEIKSQIEDMKKREVITEKEAEVINPYSVYKFFESDIGKRMKRAKFIGREKSFCRNIKASDVYKNESGEEKLMLRGIIDLYFEEDDGKIVLVDYKTDYVTEETIDEIKSRYRKQLEVYEETLEIITGKTVKEKYLYLFGLGRSVSI